MIKRVCKIARWSLLQSFSVLSLVCSLVCSLQLLTWLVVHTPCSHRYIISRGGFTDSSSIHCWVFFWWRVHPIAALLWILCLDSSLDSLFGFFVWILWLSLTTFLLWQPPCSILPSLLSSHQDSLFDALLHYLVTYSHITFPSLLLYHLNIVFALQHKPTQGHGWLAVVQCGVFLVLSRLLSVLTSTKVCSTLSPVSPSPLSAIAPLAMWRWEGMWWKWSGSTYFSIALFRTFPNLCWHFFQSLSSRHEPPCSCVTYVCMLRWIMWLLSQFALTFWLSLSLSHTHTHTHAHTHTQYPQVQ